MRLPRAAELAKPLEDQPDYLLEPEIRIEPEPGLAMPDVTDRHADPKFATTRLRPGCVDHARPDHSELELTDAALHAEQQAVVRQTGIIDAIKVDDTRLDKPAQFEQVVPVPAVARQPRSVKAEHGTDFPRAQGGDELLEAGPGDHAAGGAAEIVVDHVHGPETTTTCDLDQFILPSSALGVEFDLGLG